MTAIWDRTGWTILRLQKEWDEGAAEKLHLWFKAMAEMVKHHAEYQRFTNYYWYHKERGTWLEALEAIAKQDKITKADLDVMEGIASIFHDFDHADYLYRGKKTYGHFNEMAFSALRPKKDVRDAFKFVMDYGGN